MKIVEEMKRFILSLIRDLKLDVNHAIPEKVLLKVSLELNPKQKEALVPASEELVKEGLLEERGKSLILTQKGKDLIYQ